MGWPPPNSGNRVTPPGLVFWHDFINLCAAMVGMAAIIFAFAWALYLPEREPQWHSVEVYSDGVMLRRWAEVDVWWGSDSITVTTKEGDRFTVKGDYVVGPVER